MSNRFLAVYLNTSGKPVEALFEEGYFEAGYSFHNKDCKRSNPPPAS